ncbi:cell division protein FtsK [Nonomuraea sp. SMC257]|uniref:Cell division protein FtsK n=1 Tax=Nonomuraea montanisoli TaxID=2741721 RepID=A0A7Y6M4M8_9ACTN|nr:FtsK/SpoIIIE domain-containing protein [Nonomuraea montanisoli]NUW33650.1 cell division protein FtsK [Nonomuraea montanisoli]
MGVHVLIGGTPESGKSVSLHSLIAGAMLDPATQGVFIDGKHGVELAAWEKVAHGGIRSDIDSAIDGLDWARAQMDERYGYLAACGARKITRGMGFGLLAVVIDELATFTLHPDKKKREAFLLPLHELGARGRAAAVRIIAATQKPGSDVVPTYIRDLFDTRWALRCSTREASDTVLGSGWAARGVDASTIPLGAAGVGYLLAGSAGPVRQKGFYLSDGQLSDLAAYAAELRATNAVHWIDR